MPDGAEVGRGYVVVSPSMRGFGSSVSAQTSAVATESGKKGGKLFGEFWAKSSLGPLKAVGEGAAVILGLDKAFEFAKSSIGVAREAQITQGQVAQAILSTGGAANVSTGHVESYAKSLSDATGVSKLQIEAGERMLLTYTNVANQVGKGNDIFDRATKTANDFAVAQGVSLPSAMRVVGRALNDPIKGTALLTRYGAGLSVQTIATIKSLVAQGKTLEAQKIILNSLNERFGGSAKAADNWGKQFSTAVEDVKERVGQDLIPIMDGLEKFTVKTLIPGLEKGASAVEGFFKSLEHNQTVVSTFRDLDGAVVAVVHAGEDLATALAPGAKVLLEIGGAAVIGGLKATAVVLDGTAHAAEAVAGFFKDNEVAAAVLAGVLTAALAPAVIETVTEFGALVAMNAGAALYAIVGPVVGMVTAFAEADTAVIGFGAALDTLDLNPVGLGIAALGAAVAAVTFLWHENGNSAKQASDDAQAASKQIVSGLNLQENSVRAYSSAIAGLNKQADAIDTKSLVRTVDPNGDLTLTHSFTSGQLAQYDGLISASQQLSAKQGVLRTHTAELATTLGFSRTAVVNLANATGKDLTGNIAGLVGPLESANRAAALSHEPTKQAAADFKTLGAAGTTASDDLTKLDTSWNLLVGNFVSAKVAVAQAKDDITALQKAIKAAGGHLDEGTAKGRAAIEQLGTTSSSVDSAIQSLYTKNGTFTAASLKSARNLVSSLQSSLPKGSVAYKKFGDELDHLAKLTPGQGAKAGAGFASGLAGQSGKAGSAAQSVVGRALAVLEHGNASSKGVLLTQGFAAGMRSNDAWLAVASAAATVISWALSALDKHGKKNSPYHAFNPNGESATGGFAVGMVSPASLAVLDSAAKTVISHAADAMTDAQDEHELKHLTKGVGSFVTAWQKDLSKELGAKSITKQFADEQEKNAKAFESSWTHRLDTVGARLTVLDNRYKSTESTAKSFASGITSNLTSGLSLGNAGTATVTGGIGFLKQENTGLSAFMHNLDTMRRKGFSPALVDDIAQEGLDQGGPLAASYAHATAAQVKRLNALESHARSTARLIGSDAEAQTYGKKLDRQLAALHHIENKIGTIGNQVVSAENKVDKHAKLKKKTATGKPS